MMPDCCEDIYPGKITFAFEIFYSIGNDIRPPLIFLYGQRRMNDGEQGDIGDTGIIFLITRSTRKPVFKSQFHTRRAEYEDVFSWISPYHKFKFVETEKYVFTFKTLYHKPFEDSTDI